MPPQEPQLNNMPMPPVSPESETHKKLKIFFSIFAVVLIAAVVGAWYYLNSTPEIGDSSTTKSDPTSFHI